jgi:hypothetical protein
MTDDKILKAIDGLATETTRLKKQAKLELEAYEQMLGND